MKGGRRSGTSGSARRSRNLSIRGRSVSAGGGVRAEPECCWHRPFAGNVSSDVSGREYTSRLHDTAASRRRKRPLSCSVALVLQTCGGGPGFHIRRALPTAVLDRKGRVLDILLAPGREAWRAAEVRAALRRSAAAGQAEGSPVPAHRDKPGDRYGCHAPPCPVRGLAPRGSDCRAFRAWRDAVVIVLRRNAGWVRPCRGLVESGWRLRDRALEGRLNDRDPTRRGRTACSALSGLGSVRSRGSPRAAPRAMTTRPFGSRGRGDVAFPVRRVVRALPALRDQRGDRYG